MGKAFLFFSGYFLLFQAQARAQLIAPGAPTPTPQATAATNSSGCAVRTGVLKSGDEAFIRAVNKQIIPEIMGLKQDETLPTAVIRKYSTRTIGTSLVQRLHPQRDTPVEGGIQYDFFHDTEIQLAFDDSKIDAIKTGCFKNQHQSGASHGSFDPFRRAAKEDGFAGIRLEEQYGSDNKINQVRPVYAYLGIQRATPGLQLSALNPQYGNVVAVFKKDVKSRVTFSSGDSLGLDPPRIRTLSATSAENLGNDSYWEAQIWGGVCFSDVAYFLVDCPGLHNVPHEAVQKLKALKMPVYRCKGDGRQMFQGDRL